MLALQGGLLLRRRLPEAALAGAHGGARGGGGGGHVRRGRGPGLRGKGSAVTSLLQQNTENADAGPPRRRWEHHRWVKKQFGPGSAACRARPPGAASRLAPRLCECCECCECCAFRNLQSIYTALDLQKVVPQLLGRNRPALRPALCDSFNRTPTCNFQMGALTRRRSLRPTRPLIHR